MVSWSRPRALKQIDFIIILVSCSELIRLPNTCSVASSASVLIDEPFHRRRMQSITVSVDREYLQCAEFGVPYNSNFIQLCQSVHILTHQSSFPHSVALLAHPLSKRCGCILSEHTVVRCLRLKLSFLNLWFFTHPPRDVDASSSF
jgi:hypothetical protein